MRVFFGLFLFVGCASGEGGDGGTDGTDQGLVIGEDCTDDAECESELCRDVFLDLEDTLCVTPCTSQADCPEGDEYFCEPTSAGSSDGYCVPRSPAHCASCTEDDDCGPRTPCVALPDEESPSCLVDCSLAGDAACPSDYTCETVDVLGDPRTLCVPDGPCADATGGFCDRIPDPQACTRLNEAGSCTGARECDEASDRFGRCDASAPQCKESCSAEEEAGCTTGYCPGATADVGDCGACGNECPGVGSPNANVSCRDATDCLFSCQGESYDVDGDAETGCEILDSPLANHTQASAVFVGTFSCDDGASNPNISGSMPSDARTHESPTVDGFDEASGAAPDFYRIRADGGLCENEVVFTLDVSGEGPLDCYHLTVTTNVGTYECDTDGSGSCVINENGTGLYSDDTDIFVEVLKTCDASTTDDVSYTVTGHL